MNPVIEAALALAMLWHARGYSCPPVEPQECTVYVHSRLILDVYVDWDGSLVVTEFDPATYIIGEVPRGK